MKKEQITQLKISEANGEAFVTDDKSAKSEEKKRKHLQKIEEKRLNKERKKEISKQEKNNKLKTITEAKKNRETKKINYFKKLHIIRNEIKSRKEAEKQEAIEYEKRISNLYKKQKLPAWLRLDNAGMIYPPARKKNWNFVYRITAVTHEKVDINALSKAVEDIIPRFPSFNVCLKKGLFWNYFERATRKLTPQKDNEFPCVAFNIYEDPNLIRVIYDDYKICFECFHALSDGRGSLTFLNSLLARYFEICGKEINDYTNILKYKDMPKRDEIEDSFLKYANNDKTKRPQERPAYKIKGTQLDDGVVNSIVAEFSVQEIKDIAKKLNCSITVLLSACIGYVAHKNKTNNKKPVRISVPIDCRTRFESSTLRNFSSYINVDVDGENLSLEDCIDIFKKNFARIDNDFLLSNINANVRLQKNPFIKIVPRFLKSLIMKNAFNVAGENYQTLAFSNIGIVKVPKEFENLIDRYEVNLGKSGHNTKSMGIISFGDKLTITFSSNIEENQTEKDYFTLLSSLGLNIKIISNRRDIYGSI